MLDFDAICCVSVHLAFTELSSELNFECYLSWPEVLLDFIVCIRCLILMLFVVAGHVSGSHCLSSMLDSDAICRGRKHFWRSLLAPYPFWLKYVVACSPAT